MDDTIILLKVMLRDGDFCTDCPALRHKRLGVFTCKMNYYDEETQLIPTRTQKCKELTEENMERT